MTLKLSSFNGFFPSTMTRCCFFFLLFCLLTVIPSSIAAVKYHGKNRFWTVVTKKDGEAEKTYLALHQYRGDATKLIFPKETGLLPIQTYSTSNKTCTDAGKLNFRFTVKPEYYLRGEVKREAYSKYGVVTASMYEKCVGIQDEERSTPYIAPDMETGESIDRSRCLTGNVEFEELVANHTKCAVDFQVDGTFGCSAFLILDSDTMIKDEPLATAHRIPLNASEEEEWKTAEHKFLPDGVKFDGQKNPNFDLSQMVPSTPYFVRYGDNQPIPTFQFNIGASCSGTSFDVQINENLGDDCKIHVDVVDGGVKVKTKHGDGHLTSDSAAFSFSMLFDLEAVYIKTADPVQIERLGICKIVNAPADQLNFRVSMGTATCEDVKLMLLQADVEQGIDVLINQTKAFESITTIAPTVQDDDKAANAPDEKTDQDAATATASFEWWIWAIIGVVVSIVLGGIVAGVVVLCIRRRREKQRKLMEKKSPQKLSKGQENNQKPSKSDAPKEEKDTTSKRNKKKKAKRVPEKTDDDSSSKVNEKKKETKDEDENIKDLRHCLKPVVLTFGKRGESKSKKRSKSKKKRRQGNDEKENKGSLPPLPSAGTPKRARSKSKKKRRPKPYIGEVGRVSSVEDMPISPVVQSTQDTGTIENKADPKLPSKSKPTPLPLQPILKHPLMYDTDDDDFAPGKPYDYHAGETATFELAALSLPSIKKRELKNFVNFWECIKNLASPLRYSPVYVNTKIPAENCFFVVRDLVADSTSYAPFRSLSTRILEPMKKDGETSLFTETTTDGEKKYYLLRVFILFYHPLTLEIHCRGQCPLFLFTMFDCDDCPTIRDEMQKSDWITSTATCNDDWNTFVCRVKRTPMNSHQFLSYNGAEKPNNSEDVNHLMVIRSDKKPTKRRPCVRGCKFFNSFAHQNNCSIETEQQRSPTLATQTTQNGSNSATG